MTPAPAAFTVLRVITRLNVGGPAQHVAYLTAGLAPHGFASELVAGRIDPGEGDMAYFCGKVGVDVHFIDDLRRPISPLRDLRAFFRIAGILWSRKPAILHTHLAKAGFLARLAARLLRPFGVRPLIIHTYHGHVFHSYFSNRQNTFHLFLERLAARWTHRLIAVSERLKRELVHTYRIAPESKFRVVQLGFDLDPFLKTPRHAGAFRRKLGVDRDTKLVGIVGRLTAVKDHLMFLDSFADLIKTGVKALAVIVGDGEERARIESHAERIGISQFVRWTGFEKNLPEIYSDLDIVALTSKNEGTPVAVIEAQAAGCPVVAADVGGVSDALLATPRHPPAAAPEGCEMRDGGILVKTRTCRAFTEAYRRIILEDFRSNDPVRKAAAEHFSAAKLCENTAHLYKNLMTVVRPTVLG
ncbi:glycosyltransferase [bacterium]|nr:glycosyltransferase [bacterium]